MTKMAQKTKQNKTKNIKESVDLEKNVFSIFKVCKIFECCGIKTTAVMRHFHVGRHLFKGVCNISCKIDGLKDIFTFDKFVLKVRITIKVTFYKKTNQKEEITCKCSPNV